MIHNYACLLVLSLRKKPSTEDTKGNPAENIYLNSRGSKSVRPTFTKNVLKVGGGGVELTAWINARPESKGHKEGKAVSEEGDRDLAAPARNSGQVT